MIALIDCNAFYCSAEILFRPWLRDTPVVVVSSNDGCVVSRTDEAKGLGIKMGQPLFKLKHLVKSRQLTVFSSNYELYQSISNRVMAVIHEHSPRSSVYSIDESFADLSGIEDLEAWGISVRDTVMRRLGMPVGVGIGRTMTLAKLANYAAKKWKKKTQCVVVLDSQDKERKLLAYAPVNEIWGIGSETTKHLSEMGILKGIDLANADPKWLRKMLNVNMERTARELSGTQSFVFGCESPEKKQMITCSRSFGNKLTELSALESAVTRFVCVAAEKMRRQNSLAQSMKVFASSSPFRNEAPFYGSINVRFSYPTQDTRVLTQAALEALRSFYREGVLFAKAGVILSNLMEEQGMTHELFERPLRNSDSLMKVMDAINHKQGRGTLRLARDVEAGPWKMNRDYLSAAYTTRWSDLPNAR